jgi:cytochrome bd-type quinol oxidase subunit 2
MKAALVLLVLFYAGAGMYLQFTNPDMTETRLLFTYWWFFLPPFLVIVTVFIAVFAATVGRKRP